MSFKDMLHMLKSYKSQVAIIVVLAAIISILTAITPFVSKKMIDEGLISVNMATVIFCAALLIALSIGGRFIEYAQKKVEVTISNSMGKELKVKAFEHGMKLKPSYYKDQGFYKTIGDALYDIGVVLGITESSFLTFFVIICKTVGAAVGLAILDWRLALCIAAMIPVKYAINLAMRKRAEKMGEKCMDNNKRYNTWFDDVISGIIDIKLWNLKDKKMQECDKLVEDMNESQKKLTLLHAKNELISFSVQNTIINLIYIVGAVMISGQTLTLGGLVAFISFSSYLLLPVDLILNMRIILKQIGPSINSLKEFFALEEENYKLLRPVQNDIQTIEFKHVSVKLGEKFVLKNLSFQLNKHDKLLIAGDNGSGKTTILNLLLRIYEPTEGQILFDGVPIGEYGVEDYRSKFSVVTQDIHLFKGTIDENICLDAKEFNSDDLLNNTEYRFATDFIKKCKAGLQTEVGASGAKMSGGEKQKIALLRALHKKARILVLDEATANYDKQSDRMFNEFIRRNQDYDFYIIVSHRKEIVQYADKIVSIDGGKLVGIERDKGGFLNENDC